MACTCMAATGTGSVFFIGDVTDDCNSRMNYRLYRNTLSAEIQPKDP
uniref:Uncharacterized protein n=1 Tax=Anguilla anguilla TaxID=7936 RepID=A0A0E9XTV1_ANGAN